MLDKLTYISSTNKRIEFGESGSNIIINTNDLRDYEWSATQFNQRIKDFKKEAVTRTLPVLIWGDNVKEIANDIHDIIEEDVANKQYGKLYSGDYYLQGYFSGSTKTNYTADGFLKFNLIFTTDNPWWILEKSYRYRPNDPDENTMPIDALGNSYIINTSFMEQDLRIIVRGWIYNPAITIGGHIYRIYVTLQTNDYLTIDTMNKTVIADYEYLQPTNVFYQRDRENYIFEKVKTGKQIFSVSANIDVDVVILQKRSEPRWQ